MENTTFIQKLRRHREAGLMLILFIMCMLLAFMTKSFLTSDNIFNVLKQATLVAIIAIGQT